MRIPKLFWIILLMVTPWGVCELITWLTFGHHFYEAIPLWSDELCYWHESLSFASVGLKMGYSTFSEHIPAWSCFGPHGIGATLLYTPMAMLCGANYDFITITNLLLLTLALFFFSRHLASKIDFLFIITLTAIYPPLFLYLPTLMTEVAQYALCIGYGILLYKYIKCPSAKCFVITLVYVSLIAFVRVYYIILLVPFLFLLCKTKNWKMRCLYVLCYCVYCIFVFAVVSALTAPYPYGFLVNIFQGNIASVLKALCVHTVNNIGHFMYAPDAAHIEQLQRWFYLGVLGYMLYRGIKAYSTIHICLALLLGSFFLVIIGAYDVFAMRDYRVLAPLPYIAIILSFLSEKHTTYKNALKNVLNVGVLLYCSMMVPYYLYKGMICNQAGRFATIAEIPLLQQILFNKNTDNNFDNTLLMPFDKLTSDIVMNIPAGIGISIMDSKPVSAYQSQYILLGDNQDLAEYHLVLDNGELFLYQRN